MKTVYLFLLFLVVFSCGKDNEVSEEFTASMIKGVIGKDYRDVQKTLNSNQFYSYYYDGGIMKGMIYKALVVEDTCNVIYTITNNTVDDFGIRMKYNQPDKASNGFVFLSNRLSRDTKGRSVVFWSSADSLVCSDFNELYKVMLNATNIYKAYSFYKYPNYNISISYQSWWYGKSVCLDMTKSSKPVFY